MHLSSAVAWTQKGNNACGVLMTSEREIDARGARVYSLADRLGRTEEYAHVGRNTLQRLSVDIGMMERPTSSRGYHSRETKRNPISATLPSGVVVGGT